MCIILVMPAVLKLLWATPQGLGKALHSSEERQPVCRGLRPRAVWWLSVAGSRQHNTPLWHSTFHLHGRAEPSQLCSIRLVNVTGEPELETIAGDGFRCLQLTIHLLQLSSMLRPCWLQPHQPTEQKSTSNFQHQHHKTVTAHHGWVWVSEWAVS